MRYVLLALAVCVCSSVSAGESRSYYNRSGSIVMRAYHEHNGNERYYNPWGRRVGGSTVRRYGQVDRRIYYNRSGTNVGTSQRTVPFGRWTNHE